MKADLTLEQLRQLVGLVEYDAESDVFPVTGWDAICFVVGNATQAAHYYASAWGMELVAYSGPENGNRDHKSFVLKSGLDQVRAQRRRLARTARSSPTTRPTATASSTSRSRCPTSTSASRQARSAGATVVRRARDAHRRARLGADRRDRDVRRDPAHPRPADGRRPTYAGPYLPGYVATAPRWTKRDGEPKRLFQALDHIVGNVELGQMDEWVSFYNRVMGFVNMAEFIGDDIATDYSALMSKVVANGNHRVKFPLNEPAIAAKKSQIDEYLEFYRGPGAQHLALATGDILATGRRAARQRRGVPGHPRLLLRGPRAARAHRRGAGADRGAAEARRSWSTATRTATSCRSSPSRWATGRRCSSS